MTPVPKFIFNKVVALLDPEKLLIADAEICHADTANKIKMMA